MNEKSTAYWMARLEQLRHGFEVALEGLSEIAECSNNADVHDALIALDKAARTAERIVRNSCRWSTGKDVPMVALDTEAALRLRQRMGRRPLWSQHPSHAPKADG